MSVVSKRSNIGATTLQCHELLDMDKNFVKKTVCFTDSSGYSFEMSAIQKLLPTGSDEYHDECNVEFYENDKSFPKTGETNKVYVDKTNSMFYLWNPADSNYKVASSEINGVILNGGNAYAKNS